MSEQSRADGSTPRPRPGGGGGGAGPRSSGSPSRGGTPQRVWGRSRCPASRPGSSFSSTCKCPVAVALYSQCTEHANAIASPQRAVLVTRNRGHLWLGQGREGVSRLVGLSRPAAQMALQSLCLSPPFLPHPLFLASPSPRHPVHLVRSQTDSCPGGEGLPPAGLQKGTLCPPRPLQKPWWHRRAPARPSADLVAQGGGCAGWRSPGTQVGSTPARARGGRPPPARGFEERPGGHRAGKPQGPASYNSSSVLNS